MKRKNEFWQIVRGICILAVIMIHCPNALDQQHNYSYYLWIFIRSLVNFPVPLFFFLAGFFTPKDISDPKDFYKKRFLRLIPPYLIWSVFYIAINSIIKHRGFDPTEVIKVLLTGRAATPFYYIIVLIQLIALTPAINNLIKKRKSIVIYVMPAIMLAITYYFGFSKKSIPWYCDTTFPMWIGFYTLGMQLKVQENDCKRKVANLSTLSLFTVFGFIVNLAESYYLLKINVTPSLAVSQNRIGGFAYALTIIGLLYKLSYNKHSYNKHLVWLGDNSYAIYFTHYLVLNSINQIIPRKFLDIWAVKFGVVFFATITLTCLIIEIIQMCATKAKKQKYLRYIGF